MYRIISLYFPFYPPQQQQLRFQLHHHQQFIILLHFMNLILLLIYHLHPSLIEVIFMYINILAHIRTYVHMYVYTLLLNLILLFAWTNLCVDTFLSSIKCNLAFKAYCYCVLFHNASTRNYATSTYALKPVICSSKNSCVSWIFNGYMHKQLQAQTPTYVHRQKLDTKIIPNTQVHETTKIIIICKQR